MREIRQIRQAKGPFQIIREAQSSFSNRRTKNLVSCKQQRLNSQCFKAFSFGKVSVRHKSPALLTAWIHCCMPHCAYTELFPTAEKNNKIVAYSAPRSITSDRF